MTKKCNCKKCVYCKQIVTSTPIFRVNCKMYGENTYKPTYCDQYKTKEEEFEIVQQETNFQEYVRTIIERSNKRLHDELQKIKENKQKGE